MEQLVKQIEQKQAQLVQLDSIWNWQEYSKLEAEISDLEAELGGLRLKKLAEIVGTKNVVVSLA
jgi:hypothetical protein